MRIDQTHRFIAIEVGSLPSNTLGLRSFSVQEHLGNMYQIHAELSSEDGQIDFDEVVNKEVTIRLNMPKDKHDSATPDVRYFHGLVNRLVQVADSSGYSHYNISIVPSLWKLTRRANCRIFPLQGQEQTQTQATPQSIPDIIKTILDEHGIIFDFGLLDMPKYPKREYCVQYRETDFAFISRLMEEEGIFYFFRHEDGKHTLVLADAESSLKEYPGYKQVRFQESTQGDTAGERIIDWVVEKEIQSDSYCLKDFDFENPNPNMNPLVAPANERADLLTQIYHYPGRYVKQAEGDWLANLRLNEVKAQGEMLYGQATAQGLATGSIFNLKDHPRYDKKKGLDCLVTSLTLHADAGEFASPAGGASDAQFFTCSFTAIPKSQPFCPPRHTPRPVVDGPQTAIVVGPDGEEIHTDEHARVKVQFHWDRYGKRDENASCWIRVSQLWAGKSWGAVYIPRIGQEVIVEFLEGDPDRPIITGRVYNGDQPPPYGLPDNKTRSTIKSNSTKGGGGSNEFRFEDKKGSEEVFLHGEKDWTIHIKNCENETVGSSISTNAGGNISRNSGADISRTADDNITDKAGKNITVKSGQDMDLQAGGSYQLHTNLSITIKALNFAAALIESGAKDAAEAIKKGVAGTAAAAGKAGAAAAKKGGDRGAIASAAGHEAAAGLQNTGMAALAALSPAIEACSGELTRMTNESVNSIVAKGNQDIAAVADSHAKLIEALDAGAPPAAVAAAFMHMAGAVVTAVEDAAKVVKALTDLNKLISSLFPQIPSIQLWAMKDIEAFALWSMSLTTKVRDISLEAKNKDINVTADKNINIEAKKKDVNIKASKKKILVTAKEDINVTSEDKDIVIEAKQKKVFIKSAKQIFLQCGDASISMADSGNIVIKGAKININGSGPVTVKGAPIKLN